MPTIEVVGADPVAEDELTEVLEWPSSWVECEPGCVCEAWDADSECEVWVCVFEPWWLTAEDALPEVTELGP